MLDWSYRLLSPAEQEVLARASVFAASGFDLEAAEAVCASGRVEEFEVLDHLDALIDKSLIQAEDSAGAIRYRLLETVRAYATAKLERGADGQADPVRTAHRDHFLRLAEILWSGLTGPDAVGALDRLEVEHDNLRAALSHSLLDPDPLPGLRLAFVLSRFWSIRGYDLEGSRHLAEHLARPDAQAPSLERCKALCAQSMVLAERLGDPRAAEAHAEDAVRIARHLADEELLARGLHTLAYATFLQGEFSRATEICDEAVPVARALGDLDLLDRKSVV